MGIIDCFGVVRGSDNITQEVALYMVQTEAVTDDAADSLSSPPLSALNGRDGGHSVPIGWQALCALLSYTGWRSWGWAGMYADGERSGSA